MATRQLTTAALAAKAIRQELKKAFPAVKFSVRSENFSMGDSVDISWTDGPATADVEAITDKYQYGTFDGMTDCYNSDNRRDDIPQAKYVQTSRHMSPETRERIQAAIKERFGMEVFDDATCMAKLGQWADSVCWRAFSTGQYLQ